MVRENPVLIDRVVRLNLVSAGRLEVGKLVALGHFERALSKGAVRLEQRAQIHLPVVLRGLPSDLGMSFTAGVRYALEDSLSAGCEQVTVSVVVVCRLSASTFAARSRVQGIAVVVRLASDTAPSEGTVSLFQFSLARDGDVLYIHEESHSVWALHEPLQSCHFQMLKESCSGIGALGMGAVTAGLRVVALNELQPVTCRLLRQITEVPVVEGDIGDQAVLLQMWQVEAQPCVLSAGVSCQPYSRLGDKRGGRDPRAMSLPRVLQAGLLLQSSAIVIECVPQASKDAFVRTCLEEFCVATGYHCAELQLELADVWAARRARWWCVLSPPLLGPCRLQPWPSQVTYATVGDVLHHTLPMHASLSTLELTPYEVRQFSTRHPMSSYLLQTNAPMSTSLHSAACQVYPCPCGCRSLPFTEERLDQNLIATVVVCHGAGFEAGDKYRHLAPAEIAFLNGLTPLGPWGAHPRLAVCLIGQLASPLQSAWVFSHLCLLAHDKWPSEAAPPRPQQTLDDARLRLLQEGVVAGLRTPAVGAADAPSLTAEEVTPESHSVQTLSVPAADHPLPTQPSQDLPDFPEAHAAGAQHEEKAPDAVQDDATRAGHWTRASHAASLVTYRAEPYQVTQGGTRMREIVAEESTTAWQLAHSASASNFFPWQMRTRADCYVSPHKIVQPGEVLRFSHVDSAEGITLPLAFMMPPPAEVSELLRPSVSSLTRARLLHLQKDRLADDQMDYALREAARLASCPVVSVEAALLLASMQHQSHAFLEDRLREVRLLSEFGVIGAIPVAGHWIAFAWMVTGDTVAAWNSFAPRSADACIGVTNCVLGRAMHRNLAQFRFLDGPVRPLNGPHCGRFAIADLRSLLTSTPFQQQAAILAEFRALPAGLLPASQNGLVPLPTCIASGQELIEVGLAATLKDRGVPESQVKARAAAAIQALGLAKVQQAMQSRSPWKELKAIANQAVPAFQFVLPSELELATKAKAGDGRPVQSKRKQKQSPAYAVHSSRKQHSMLPALDQLSIPVGVFTSAVGDLEHLPPDCIGPHAKGVILLSHEDALPYTQVAKPVSSSALGLLVPGQVAVDGAHLPGTHLRFTARLVSSEKPILLSAYLYQLGAIEAQKFLPQQTSLVDVTPSVVVKVCLFRDEISADWAEVVRSPVRALLEAMPQLKTCKNEGCQCLQWHGCTGPGEPQAILEVWGRAFLRAGAKPEVPHAAVLFTAFLRLPAGLLRNALLASGAAGVYVEPRDCAQRTTSPEYKVIWLLRASLAEARLIKQTNVAVLGLARVGDRFGLRCAAEDEEELHGAVRPDVPFLPQGAKHVYHSGPWPPGTQKTAITKLLSSLQWRARPVQPLPGGDSTGTWWLLHAATPPTQTVIHTQAGELLLVEQKLKAPLPAPPPTIPWLRPATLSKASGPLLG